MGSYVRSTIRCCGGMCPHARARACRAHTHTHTHMYNALGQDPELHKHVHAYILECLHTVSVDACVHLSQAGAGLYDALGLEPELREYRARAVAGHVDTDFVERSIQEAVNQVRCLPCLCTRA